MRKIVLIVISSIIMLGVAGIVIYGRLTTEASPDTTEHDLSAPAQPVTQALYAYNWTPTPDATPDVVPDVVPELPELTLTLNSEIRLPTPDEYYQIIQQMAIKKHMPNYIDENGVVHFGQSDGKPYRTMATPEEVEAQKYKASQYLQTGAEMVQKLELALQARLAILQEIETAQIQAKEEGTSGTQAVINMRLQLADWESRVKQHHREIQAWLFPWREDLFLVTPETNLSEVCAIPTPSKGKIVEKPTPIKSITVIDRDGTSETIDLR